MSVQYGVLDGLNLDDERDLAIRRQAPLNMCHSNTDRFYALIRKSSTVKAALLERVANKPPFPKPASLPLAL